MTYVKFILQVASLWAICLLGDGIVRLFHWKIPGSIIGLIILFTLLQLNVVKAKWFSQGAGWLISELLLFYIPSATGIIQYGRIMELDGVRLVLVIAISTALVMMTAGLLADRISKYNHFKRR